ncbi:phospholipase [Pigmentiphaga aceris]|uniref:Phospholipase n=1 Tax=Pigmentiphaga aceris TaxID=1940612 RepID=A0A5C0B0E0_9BURK|nr:phospholipase [Pigmentiphaga aceris]QEI06580.1 phospholipase [Pigmentiphaga aceris]
MSSQAAPAVSALIEDSHSGLKYRVRAAEGDAPVARLLLLHGVGGNETNLIALGALVDPRVEILFVQGPLTLGPQQFAWFQVQFGPQGPSINAPQADQSRELLIRLIRGLATSMPPVIAGFSQGGILSASVGLTAPADVAGFAVLSGRILPEIAAKIAPREDLAKLSAFIGHGSFDDKLPVSWAERAAEWLTTLGVPHLAKHYPIGHGLSAEMADDFLQWLGQTVKLG